MAATCIADTEVPSVGDVVGYRCAIWRVHLVRPCGHGLLLSQSTGEQAHTTAYVKAANYHRLIRREKPCTSAS